MDESNSENEDIDIYGDLPVVSFEDEIKKLEDDRVCLKEALREAEERLKEIDYRNEILEKENNALRVNISTLYKTASSEIQRKDRMITELRREKESVIFRRQQKNKADTVEMNQSCIRSPEYEQELCLSPCLDGSQWPDRLIPVTVKRPCKDSEKFANILLTHYKSSGPTESPKQSDHCEEATDVLELCASDAGNSSLCGDVSEPSKSAGACVFAKECSPGGSASGKASLVQDRASECLSCSRSREKQRSCSLDSKREEECVDNRSRNRSKSFDRMRERHILHQRHKNRERLPYLDRRNEYMREDRHRMHRKRERSWELRMSAHKNRHRRDGEHISPSCSSDLASEMRGLKVLDLRHNRYHNERFDSPRFKRREGYSRNISEAFRVKSKYSRARRERSMSVQCSPRPKQGCVTVSKQNRTKHAENLGESTLCTELGSEVCPQRTETNFHDKLRALAMGDTRKFENKREILPSKESGKNSEKSSQKVPSVEPGAKPESKNPSACRDVATASDADRREAIDRIRKFRIPKRRASDNKVDVTKPDITEEKKANKQTSPAVVSVSGLEISKKSYSGIVLASDHSHRLKSERTGRHSRESSESNTTVAVNNKYPRHRSQEAECPANLADTPNRILNEEESIMEKSGDEDTPKTKQLRISTLRTSPGDPATVREGNVSISFSSEQCEFTTRRRRGSVKRNVSTLDSSGSNVSEPTLETKEESQVDISGRGVKRLADCEDPSKEIPKKKPRESSKNQNIGDPGGTNGNKWNGSHISGNSDGKDQIEHVLTNENDGRKENNANKLINNKKYKDCKTRKIEESLGIENTPESIQNEKQAFSKYQEVVARDTISDLTPTNLPAPEHSLQSASITVPRSGPVVFKRRVRRTFNLSCSKNYSVSCISEKSGEAN